MPIAAITNTITITNSFSFWRIAEATSIDAAGQVIQLNASSISLFVDGAVTATGDPISINSNGDFSFVEIGTSGMLTGGSDGIVSFADETTVINNGTIIADDNGIEARTINNLIINTGDIDASLSAIYMIGTGGHTFINSGLLEGGKGVYVNSTGNFVQNNGIIRGTSEGVEFNSGNNVLINNGNISATNGPRAFEGGSGIDRVINNGTMFGNISMDGGSDFFNNRDGVVTGIIYGEAGADTIIGGDRDENLNGGSDNDRILGGLGDDLISGASDNDFLNGEQGNDTIRGGAGNDIMRGGQGADLLNGFSGNDVLDGGQGADQLIGGTGADTFVFQILAGNDRIFGWEDGNDQIDLTAYGIASFNALNNEISASNGNAIIDLNALGGVGSIIINGAAGDLDASDFLL